MIKNVMAKGMAMQISKQKKQAVQRAFTGRTGHAQEMSSASGEQKLGRVVGDEESGRGKCMDHVTPYGPL